MRAAILLRGPGARRRQTWLIPHLVLVDKNSVLALASEPHGRKRRRRRRRGTVGQEILHTFFMSNTSLCVTVLLLPPEGRINIVPAPRRPRSPPQVTHALGETGLLEYKQTSFQKTHWLSLLPAPEVDWVTGPGLSPYGVIWSHAQFDFPLCLPD